MEGYITIATFSTEIEGELAQATLAAAGIDSFLKYEDSGHMIPVLQQAEGVKLLVTPEFVEEAKTILSTPPSEV